MLLHWACFLRRFCSFIINILFFYLETAFYISNTTCIGAFNKWGSFWKLTKRTLFSSFPNLKSSFELWKSLAQYRQIILLFWIINEHKNAFATEIRLLQHLWIFYRDESILMLTAVYCETVRSQQDCKQPKEHNGQKYVKAIFSMTWWLHCGWLKCVIPINIWHGCSSPGKEIDFTRIRASRKKNVLVFHNSFMDIQPNVIDR